jgi:hypothetical protein
MQFATKNRAPDFSGKRGWIGFQEHLLGALVPALSLAGFETRILFIDDENAALAAHDAAILIARLG